MKNFAVLLILALIGSSVFSQNKNGTVFNEHETIDVTRDFWNAVKSGDTEKAKTFFADSVMIVRNGNDWKTTADQFGENTGWWSKNFVKFNVEDSPGAYPDAIEYKDGKIWVQDWLKLTGTHEKTGINLELELHCLYAFNDDGKIAAFIQYYNNNVFEDIRNAQTTRENGKVYINHPYIATVRKLLNTYVAEDVDGLRDFFAENATFSNTAGGFNQSMNLEERAADVANHFATRKDIHFEQIGYPDCIFYELNNGFVVYSWWNYSYTDEESGKKVVMPLMLSHSFNDDGKIVQEMAYFSTNHVTD
ncbi:nuclear transport factor 2 family protein [Draconibacterium sp. IB214405]|uniref:nuclear transport factor 2 family protein n=1 Tax=Draconibacterium sp. IB214405 TaxID=3097352 RepID=UPI002A11BF72|nr:nuclear transport factor 2 family protein [Draconibacterium sp. IB214405]MDX8338032.1 nuclear transport factor 2 family protein [Draconibacterium sp. IB214405]